MSFLIHAKTPKMFAGREEVCVVELYRFFTPPALPVLVNYWHCSVGISVSVLLCMSFARLAYFCKLLLFSSLSSHELKPPPPPRPAHQVYEAPANFKIPKILCRQVPYVGTTPQASSGAFLAGKKIKLSNIFYVKETVQVVPENTHKTHRVNSSSVTLVSSIGTMVMFLSLD